MTPRRSTPRLSKSAPNGTAGFTIIEVLGAFAILSLAIGGLVYMGLLTTQGNVRSQSEAGAVSWAADKIEELKGLDFDSGSLVTGSDPTNGIYSRSWTVGTQYTLLGVPAKDLSVTVTWTGNGSVTLSTTVLKPPSMSAGALQQFPTVMVSSWTVQ